MRQTPPSLRHSESGPRRLLLERPSHQDIPGRTPLKISSRLDGLPSEAAITTHLSVISRGLVQRVVGLFGSGPVTEGGDAPPDVHSKGLHRLFSLLSPDTGLRARLLVRGGVAYQVMRGIRLTPYDAGHHLEPDTEKRRQCLDHLALVKLASVRDALQDPGSVAFVPRSGQAVRFAYKLTDTFKSLATFRPIAGSVTRVRPLQGLIISPKFPWITASPHLLVYVTPQGDDFDQNGRAEALHPQCQPHASIHVLLVRTHSAILAWAARRT